MTGTKDQIERIAKAYRVYFNKADVHEGDDYLVDHSIVIYLVRRSFNFPAYLTSKQNGPDGEFLDFFTKATSVTDCIKRITDQIKKHH